ncbi:MAG: hypothetical protein QW520_08845 [Methanomassiliicoccales archaeon]
MSRGMFYITSFFVMLVLIMFFSAISAGDSYAMWTAIMGLMVILICPLLSHLGIVQAPWPLVLAIDLSIFMHSLGLASFTLYYYNTWWWDKLMHVMTAVIVSAIVIMGLMVTERYSKNIRVPAFWIPFFVVIMVMACGVCWEIFEFLIDKSFGTNMQHSLQDTTMDLITDLIGGVIGGLVGALYLSRHTFEEFVEKLQIERAAKRVERILGKESR